MTTKTYSNRGNASAAARKALGKTAKAGKQFDLHEHTKDDKKTYSWTPKEGAKAGRPRGRKTPIYQNQPATRKLLVLCQREKGMTIKEGAAAQGGNKEHTVRAAMSRARREIGKDILTMERDSRTARYHLPKDYKFIAAAE